MAARTTIAEPAEKWTGALESSRDRLLAAAQAAAPRSGPRARSSQSDRSMGALAPPGRRAHSDRRLGAVDGDIARRPSATYGGGPRRLALARRPGHAVAHSARGRPRRR